MGGRESVRWMGVIVTSSLSIELVEIWLESVEVTVVLFGVDRVGEVFEGVEFE